LTCSFTVPSDMPRRRPMALLLWPSARWHRISCSLGVRSAIRPRGPLCWPPLALHSPGEDSRQLRRDHGTTLDDLPKGRDQSVGLHVLEEVALGPALQALNHVALLRAGREHGDGHAWMVGTQLSKHVDTVAFGHAHVEQNHIRLGLRHPTYTYQAVAQGGHDLDAPALQELLQPEAKQGMVVNQ